MLVSNGYPSSFVQKISKARTAPKKEPVAEFKSTADYWGNNFSPEQWRSKCTNHSPPAWCKWYCVTSRPHRLKKNSSKQSKRRDLQLKWLHRETNDNTLIVNHNEIVINCDWRCCCHTCESPSAWNQAKNARCTRETDSVFEKEYYKNVTVALGIVYNFKATLIFAHLRLQNSLATPFNKIRIFERTRVSVNEMPAPLRSCRDAYWD